MEGTEVNFNLSVNSRNSRLSPQASYPEITPSQYFRPVRQLGFNNLDQDDLDVVQENYTGEKYEYESEDEEPKNLRDRERENNMQEFEEQDQASQGSLDDQLVMFSNYDHFSKELEQVYKIKYLSLEQKNKELYQKNLEMVEQLTELSDYVSELKNQNDASKTDHENLAQKDTQRVQQLNSLKMELFSFQDRNHELVTIQQQDQILIEALKQENNDLSDQIADLKE